MPRIDIRNDDDLDRFVAKLPAPRRSSKERQDEYRRLRARRDRATYFTIGADEANGDRDRDKEHATSDERWVDPGAAASEAATSEDILRLYRDLLGREPENDSLVVESRVGRPLAEVVMTTALSKEFLERVRTLSASAAATEEEVVRLFALLLERKPEDL